MGVFIGADGGGTKLMLCVEKDGNPIYERYECCVNHNTAGFENSIKAVTEAICDICNKNNIAFSSVDSVFAGIAGASFGNYKNALSVSLKSIFKNAEIGVDHDGINIISAAFPESDGVIVICGTGSSCFVKKGRDIYRIGGNGIFDMDGNGYEIAKRAIAYTLKTYDKREARTVLCDKIEAKNGGNLCKNLSQIISLSNKDIASYAVCVFDAANEGDKAAEGIIEETAKYIANCIDTASVYFKNQFNVCIAGSIGENEITYNKIKSSVNGNALITKLKASPVDGALAKAKQIWKKNYQK